MKSFMKEFKEFALKGNVMDMAVGIIIGAAFTAIVTSLVDDLINPIIGLFCGKDFSNLAATFFDGQVTLKYGSFIMAVINFLIVALVLFCIIKAMNKATSLKKKEEEEEEPTTKVCPFCKSEIAVDATRCPNCTSEQPAETE
ncbi:MAG: large conductance mechanosensitive channel protein MscL [Firmicutes bacterium]|nr:large conductance mechanosensitive channel protein MscL [Bacillota bacterium]